MVKPPGTNEDFLPQFAPFRSAAAFYPGFSSFTQGFLPWGSAGGSGEFDGNYGYRTGAALSSARGDRQTQSGYAHGIQIVRVEQLSGNQVSPKPDRHVYEVKSLGPLFSPEKMADFLNSTQFSALRKKPKETKMIDIRPLVSAMHLHSPSNLEIHYQYPGERQFENQ